MTTIGILGGGAAARLLAQAAQRIGVNVAVLDPDQFSPAMQVTGLGVSGSWDDDDVLAAFADAVDAVTIGGDNVPSARVAHVAQRGRLVRPGADTLACIQNKARLKQTLRSAGLPVAPFAVISTADDLRAFAAQHGYPILLQALQGDETVIRSSRIDSEQDLAPTWERLADSHSVLLVEKLVNPAREWALVVVRGHDGQIVTYPVVEVLRWKGMIHVIRAHQRGFDHLGGDMGKAAVQAIEGVGAFGIELIELADGGRLISDVSAGVHDAGLFTIEGCLTSQFENHVRAVLGLPLGWPDMLKPAAVTVNCLGVGKPMPGPRDFARALSYRGARLHWYGERECREGQRMGHVAAIHDSLAEAERIARMAAGDLMSASAWFV